MTLIRQTPDDAPWEEVARSVFWSRDVPLEKWREGILAGHRSYLPDSIKRMSPTNFVRFLGRAAFREHWPHIRQCVPPELSKSAGPLDYLWSWLESGTFNLKPESVFMRWPGRRREIYDQVVHHPGISIYAAAKAANVPYRRAHDHVRALMDEGLVRAKEGHGPRRAQHLYPF